MADLKPGRARTFDSLIMPPVTKYPPMPSGAAVPRAPQSQPAPIPRAEPAQPAAAQSR